MCIRDSCKDMLKKAEEKGVSLLLPVDTTVASAFPDPIDAEIAVEVVDSEMCIRDSLWPKAKKKALSCVPTPCVSSASARPKVKHRR